MLLRRLAGSRTTANFRSVVRVRDGRQLDGFQLKVGGDLEVRLRSVPFGEEERKFVVLAVRQAEAVEFHNLFDRAVDAAEVDHHLPVDEHPDVVVTAEGEGLRAVGVVGELRHQLEGEVEVAVGRAARISEELPLDREEAAKGDALRIRVRVEGVTTVRLAVERERQRGGHVQLQVVLEPRRERLRRHDAAGVWRCAVFAASDIAAGGVVQPPADVLASTVLPLIPRLHFKAAALEDRLLVGAKCRLDVVAVVAEAAGGLSLKVGVAARLRALAEVANDADKRDGGRRCTRRG